MKKFYIETYGCQMNVYDSELIAGILQRNPQYVSVDSPEAADVIMLNTCSVRENAEDRIHKRLQELHSFRKKNPAIQIGIVGCMAQNQKEKLMEESRTVNFVAGPDSYRRLPGLLQELSADEHIADTVLSRDEVYEGLFPSRKDGLNAWISIMRGCDKFCTFCIVPFTRGRERSRSPESIVEEAELIISQGFAEITLLGQNVNSYRYEGQDFPDLLEALASVEGIKRIRYTSPHPQDVDDKLLSVHAEFAPKVAEHIHLPLQAGSDRVLRAMNRSYSKDHYLNLVEKIRDRVPGMAITTDIISGFPGETHADHLQTVDVMNQVRFDAAFMFKYSPRPGTKAAQMPDDVPEEEKAARLTEIIDLQQSHSLQRNQQYIGETVEILVEKTSRRHAGELMGRNSQNKTVIFPDEGQGLKQLISRKITEIRGLSLYAGN